MHVLIVSPYLPWPLFEGGRAAQYRTLEALRGSCRFTMVVPVYNLEQESDAKFLEEKLPGVTVDAVRHFQVDSALPAKTRLRRAGARFLRTMFPEVPDSRHPGVSQQENIPYYPFSKLSPSFLEAVERHLAGGCDIFQAEFAEMLSLGPLMSGRVPSLFVHHQLHHVYARRHLEISGERGVMARYLTERMICEERAYLNSFDSAIVFSEVDKKALGSFCPQLPVAVSPFPAPEDFPSTPRIWLNTTKHFVFVASEFHGPNVEGLRWFLSEVWPRIKKRAPDTVFEILGKWSVSAQAALPNHEDVRFSGFVADLGQALQGKVMVVPVRVGSGIRTKILAAWGASCPVVTTTIGAEGLPGRSGEHFLVADSAPDFANACIDLCGDLDALNRMVANGLDLAQKHYSLATVRKTRMACYENLLKRAAKPGIRASAGE